MAYRQWMLGGLLAGVLTWESSVLLNLSASAPLSPGASELEEEGKTHPLATISKAEKESTSIESLADLYYTEADITAYLESYLNHTDTSIEFATKDGKTCTYLLSKDTTLSILDQEKGLSYLVALTPAIDNTEHTGVVVGKNLGYFLDKASLPETAKDHKQTCLHRLQQVPEVGWKPAINKIFEDWGANTPKSLQDIYKKSLKLKFSQLVQRPPDLYC